MATEAVYMTSINISNYDNRITNNAWEYTDILATAGDGNAVIIPTNISKEIPFPIPYSVTNSPNHIKNIVPAVTVIKIVIVSNKLKSGIIVPIHDLIRFTFGRS